MSSKVVLILGGGVMQMPAIDAAHALGYGVHVADGSLACPGRRVSDCFHHIDLKDTEALVAAAQAIGQLQGVFTAGTDFSYAVACIAQACGLPGVPPEVARCASDKAMMRSRLQEHGVAVPGFVHLSGADPPEERLVLCRQELRLPVVCKPVDNMGSRGVERVDDWTQLRAAVERAGAFASGGRVVVEEFIQGTEYSLDALIWDNTIAITGIAERHIHFEPYFVELGHSIPARLDHESRSALTDAFMSAIRAVGITRGAAKGDVFLQPGRPPRACIGEIANRLSGGYMSGWTFPLSSGIDVTSQAIRIAVGESPERDAIEPSYTMSVAERALYSAPGIVRSWDDAGGRAMLRDQERLFVRAEAGSRVVSPSNNVEKVANVIVRDSSPVEAERRAADVLDRIDVRLRAGVEETDTFMFVEGWASTWARYGCGDTESYAALGLSRDAGPTSWAASEEIWVRDGRLVIHPIPAHIVLRSRVPGLHPTQVLESIERDGFLRFSDSGSFGKTGSGAGALFWAAFLAAGRQGVRYLCDTLALRTGTALRTGAAPGAEP